MGCSHYEIKVSYKIIDALVLATNKATCRQDKRVRENKRLIRNNHGYMKQTTMLLVWWKGFYITK